MKDFINYDIQNVTIYSKCNSTINGYLPPGSKILQMPNHGRCDHSYAHWMSNMKEDATENHVVMFLKASRISKIHSGMRYRPLNELIRIAITNGFACGFENS